MSSTLSIYIPRIAAEHDEDSIRNVMANYKIGAVSHVDFTPINKKPGFGEKVDDVAKSAFVHFSDLIMTPDNQYYYNSIYTRGNVSFWDTVLYTATPYKLQVSLGEYWLCLKNTKPVQRTMMNIHQVVENGRHLENLIEEQAEKLKAQEEKIDELSKKLDGVQQVIYQLLGGLFNQTTQSQTLEDHISVLYSEERRKRSRFEDPDYSEWENLPTTRQGDESERRIEVLEKTVREMLQFETVFTAEEDDEAQDELLQQRKHEEQDQDDSDSMPDLEEVSVDSEERIRNSFELCGNE